MLVSDELRELLSHPFSGLCPIENIIANNKGKKLVAVGDRVTLDTLKLGEVPFVAVYDYVTERRAINNEEKALLSKHFPEPETIDNAPGHFNEELLPLAK